jgi:MFS family permease
MSLLHRSRHHRIPANDTLPYGVRVFAWARAIRWIGWGFGEALLPVFIILFSKSFAEAGFFSSSVDIAGLISLPFIGLWADKVSAKRLILWSLILYPIVGISYFFAGLFGLAIYIVIARIANGITWELENVGIETYYRRTVSGNRIATSFGYIETWSSAAWIGASIVGMFLVRFMPIYYLLFLIVPFAVIAYFVALKAPKDSPKVDNKPKSSFFHTYRKAVSEWRTWDAGLWMVSVLILFSSILSTLMFFFIPIDAYLTGANLPMVILITVLGAVPALFGYQLGHLADIRNKYYLIAIGLCASALIVVGLVVFPQYWFKLVAVFLIGIILELFYVVQSALITTFGPSETYGQRGSAFDSVITLGDLAAPLMLGIGLDVIGFSNVSFIVAGVALLLGIQYLFQSKEKI